MNKNEIWEKVDSFIRAEIPELLYNKRIAGMKYARDGVICIQAKDQFSAEWCAGRLTCNLTKYIKEEFDRENVSVIFRV